jgi:hypothetical protein
MTNRLRACGHCLRHFKVTDARCPFCATPGGPTKLAGPRVCARLSRAQWFALTSSLALTGCVGTRADDAGSGGQVADGGAAPIGQGVQSCDASCYTCASSLLSAAVLPPDVSCSRLGQYCTGDNGYYCVHFDAGPFAALFAHADGACRTRPTCACLGLDMASYEGGVECTVPNHNCYYLGCADDDAGGISLQYHIPCYGAPPARVG